MSEPSTTPPTKPCPACGDEISTSAGLSTCWDCWFKVFPDTPEREKQERKNRPDGKKPKGAEPCPTCNKWHSPMCDPSPRVDRLSEELASLRNELIAVQLTLDNADVERHHLRNGPASDLEPLSPHERVAWLVKSRDDWKRIAAERNEELKAAGEYILEKTRNEKTLGVELDEARRSIKYLTQERDAARSERDKCIDFMEKANATANEQTAPLTPSAILHEVRPSRLMVAAILASALQGNPLTTEAQDIEIALLRADRLIAAEKEVAR